MFGRRYREAESVRAGEASRQTLHFKVQKNHLKESPSAADSQTRTRKVISSDPEACIKMYYFEKWEICKNVGKSSNKIRLGMENKSRLRRIWETTQKHFVFL